MTHFMVKITNFETPVIIFIQEEDAIYRPWYLKVTSLMNGFGGMAQFILTNEDGSKVIDATDNSRTATGIAEVSQTQIQANWDPDDDEWLSIVIFIHDEKEV